MHPLTPIYQAYDEGRAALRLSGRPRYDLIPDEDGAVRPLIESLRRGLRRRYGMALITYSLAEGLDWDEPRIADERDRRTLATALRTHRLVDIAQDQNETVRVIRGISTLCRMPAGGMRWADNSELRLGFLFEFTEHLMPGAMASGTQSDPQLVAIELAHLTSQSLALRASGNLVMFHGREGLLDELVCGALHGVRIPLASEEEKRAFLAAAATIYPKARFEDGLTPEAIASLTSNTTNRGAEELMRASERTGRAITVRELTEQKSRDVETLSEQTLTVLDTRRVADLHLAGRNIAVPAHVLGLCSEALLRGDPSMPANILLAGAPGTGKTDLAIRTAALAKVAAYELHSPKGSLVGETERKSRIQQTVAREWTPNICFADEITEKLPLQRSEFDGDSGASRAVMAAMLTALSDETRRGKSLLVASTNCLWRIGKAMLDRFTVIPVLQPLAGDFPAIVAVTAARVDRQAAVDIGSPQVLEAARMFHEKGATPRHIRSALSNALLLKGRLTADTILFAARDYTGMSGQASAIYSDLWAIKCCSSSSFLPWCDDPEGYPYPPYLAGLVDATGRIDEGELNRRIEQYRGGANV